MCDQTVPYTPGTWVWAEILSRYWWPGKIVDISSVPKELDKYRKTKRNPIAAVYFERDKSYEIVANLNKVCLYSSNKKLEFLKKGYALYLKQQKSGYSSGGLDMKNFIDDVINVEKIIGGDINIFDQFKEKKVPEEKKIPQEVINELFMTEKERKKREKDRRSLPSLRTPVKKPKITGKHVTPMQSPRHSIVKMPVVPQSLVCPFCNKFSTTRYTMLKLHMDAHKNEGKDNKKEDTSMNNKSPVTKRSSKNKKSVSICSTSSLQVLTPKKRNYTRTKKTDTKGNKIQDELLKDWEDGEDLDENITDVKAQDYNSDSNESTDLNSTEKKDTAEDKDKTQDKGTDKDKVTDSLVSKTTNKASSTRVFDFDENDDLEIQDSFQSHSNIGISSDNSFVLSNKNVCPTMASISKIIGLNNENNSSYSVEKELQTSTSNDINIKLSDVENNLEDTRIQTENITTDIIKDTSINKDNSDDVQQESIDTEDKVDAELGHNIENFLSSLSDSNLFKSDWEKQNLKNELGKGIKADFTKKLKTEAHMKIRNNDNTNINETLFSIPHDVEEQPEPAGCLKIFLPRIPPVHTNEELVKLEAFQRIMEIAEAGGEILFTIDSPIYYEEPKK